MTKRSYIACEDCIGRDGSQLWKKLNAVDLEPLEHAMLHRGEIDKMLHLEGDYYVSARHKLALMAFLEDCATTGQGDLTYFNKVFFGKVRRNNTFLHHDQAYMPPWHSVLQFLAFELEIMRDMDPPIDPPVEYLVEIAFRWGCTFPAMWYLNVSTESRGLYLLGTFRLPEKE